MNAASVDVSAVAGRLWAQATATTSSNTEIACAVERLFSQLRVGLLPWAGADGYHALLDRAIGEVELEHPLLGGLAFLGSDNPTGASLTAEGEAQAAAELETVTIALVTALIHAFSRFVGDTLAVRLVDQTDFSPSFDMSRHGYRGIHHV